MNIKINIGGNCDCSPSINTKKQMSEVQFKKKSMLYAPPTKDKKLTANSQINNQNTNNKINKNTQKTISTTQNNITQNQQNHESFLEAERKLVQDLSEISKNHGTQDMQNHTNTIFQRQNQIIESNQKTIQNLLNQPSRLNINTNTDESQSSKVKKIFQESADKIAKQVKQIKKMRDEILQAGDQFKRLLLSQDGNKNINKGTQQIGNMNTNLKNLVEISKNHIEGLQNIQGIKSLQNFNIEAYTQSIHTLKKQIIQYQKQSENIEHELKLRAAKLSKLQISPNFDQQLLQPYEDYLRKKVLNIDLHAIKQRVYEKLGQFDYGKFQYDTTLIMNDVKNQMSEFQIVCKQYRIDAPDIRIDQKQLKMLDFKMTSVLDQYKQAKGIKFNSISQDLDHDKGKGQSKRNININMKKTQQLQNAFKDINQHLVKKPDNQRINNTNSYKQTYQQNKQISSKPIDYSNQVKLTRLDKDKYNSVLETKVQTQKKRVQKSVKQNAYKNNRHDEQFQKYLQNRAREQLTLIYEQKRNKLKSMQKQLYQTCKQQVKPVYELKFDLKNRLQIEKKNNIDKTQTIEQQYEDDFEEKIQIKRQQIKKYKQTSKEEQQLKSIGTEVLKEKLKNIFTKSNITSENAPVHGQHMNFLMGGSNNQGNYDQMNMQTMANGFINMINNTLTQINGQLSTSIHKKMQNNRSLSKQSKGEFERKLPNQISIPKLQEFRAPPVFNMHLVQQPVYVNNENNIKREKKIVKKDYQHLRIQQQNDSDLEVSGLSFD